MSRYGDFAPVREFLDSIRPVDVGVPLTRIGGAGDGGYLLPDDLININECFSPGVGGTVQFESHLDQMGIISHLADGSHQILTDIPDGWTYLQKNIDILEGEQSSLLEKWVSETSIGGGDYIMQMDIEGAEYRVLTATPKETLAKFRIICVEFHRLERVFFRDTLSDTKALFNKLCSCFDIVHAHPNNRRGSVGSGQSRCPRLLELTFLRKDRRRKEPEPAMLPHPLDQKNVDKNSDTNFPNTWFK